MYVQVDDKHAEKLSGKREKHASSRIDRLREKVMSKTSCCLLALSGICVFAFGGRVNGGC